MLPTVGKAILLFLGAVVVLATALPLLRTEAWWVRIFDFPRVQILFLGAVVLALYALVSHLRLSAEITFLLLLSASIAYQGWCIFPYTVFAKEEVRASSRGDNEQTLRLLVANVLMTNRSADGLRKIIAEEKPDIVLVLEADRWWEERLRPLEKEFTHTLKQPQDNTYGMLLYSRLEFLESEIHFLIRKDVPSFRVQFRLHSGDRLDFWGLHPEPPTPAESELSTPRDAELLLVGRAVRDLRRPVIVAGDLNDVAWSYTTRLFQKISGLLDPRIGRGRFSTFHAEYPILRWPLDHVFHSDHFRLVELKVLPAFGSDHFPILAALSFEPEKKKEQKEPEAGPEDQKEAQEKIDEGMREEKP
jgi:endonuclease/exonuclease/phosphatase (EEP) superfamily protein YafD